MQKKNISLQSKALLAFILTAAFLAYTPAMKNGWTKWDDHKYIIENPSVENFSAHSIRQMFSVPVQGNYIPLTFLSFTLEKAFFGEKPKTFILDNILLHLINSLLVFFLLRMLLKDEWVALVSAMLFALHPMHVESVAWIAERKDVLYAFFLLLSLIVYLKYLRSEKIIWLGLSFLLMALSLLSKSIAVVIPFLLLALDNFSGKRLTDKKVILEKVPFILLSVLFFYIARNSVEANAASMSTYHLSLPARVAMASYAFAHYLAKLLIPSGLSAYYPYPFLPSGTMPGIVWAYLLISTGGLCALFWWGRRNRLLVFSFFFFFINLIPLLQLYPVGDALMADRFVYVASIGFFLPFIYGAGILKETLSGMQFRVNASVLIIAAYFFYGTHQRCFAWKDSKTLWTDVLTKNNSIALAHVNLGSAFFEERKKDSAFFHFGRAIELDPQNKDANYNRGVIYFGRKEFQKAVADFQRTVCINSRDAGALASLGISYTQLARYDSALTVYDACLGIDSLNAEVFLGRGLVKHLQRNLNGAMQDYSHAIELHPDLADAFNKRGVLKIEMGDTTGACKDWQIAQKLGSLEVEAILKVYCK